MARLTRSCVVRVGLLVNVLFVQQLESLTTASPGGEETTLAIGYVAPRGRGWSRQVDSWWAEVEAASQVARPPGLRVSLEPIQQPYQLTLRDMTTAFSFLESRNFSVIVGPENAALRLAATERNIPYVITSRPSPMTSQLPGHLSLYMWPEQKVIRRAILDLVLAFSWDHAALLYTDDSGLYLAGDLMALPDIVVRSWRLLRNNRKYLRDQLLDIRVHNIRKIIVTGNVRSLPSLLDEALRLSMLSSLYSWILADMWSAHIDLTPYRYTQVNLTTLMLGPLAKMTTSKVDNYKNVVIDTFDQLLNASADYVFFSRHVCSPASCLPPLVPGGHLYARMKKKPWHGRTGIITFTNKGPFRSNVTLSILSLSENGVKPIGEWHANGDKSVGRLRLQIRRQRPTVYAPHPLGRQVLNIVIMIDAPFIMRHPDYAGLAGNDRYRGFLVDLIQQISIKLVFQYRLYESPDGNYGTQENGKWNGMVGELIIGNASMCLGAISITSDREEAVDFTKPFMQKTFNILIKKPEEKTSPFQFLWPFSTRIWIFTLSVMLLVGFLLALMDRFSPNFEKGCRKRFNVNESVWFIYGSLVGPGSDVFPTTFSGRILSAAWWFFSLILVSSYTANLAAFLTVTRIETPIKTIADLSSQTQIKYGTVRNTYAHSLFKNSKIETIKKMWTFMNDLSPDSMVDDTESGIEKVKSGDYAFIWDSPINRYTATHECDTMVVGEPFDEKGLGIGVPMGAPYRDDVTMAILSLQEEGFTQKLVDKWWGGGRCAAFKKTSTSGTKELDMPNIAGIFLVITGGAALAVVVCFLEYIHRRLMKRRLNKKKCRKQMEQETSVPVLPNSVMTPDNEGDVCSPR